MRTPLFIILFVIFFSITGTAGGNNRKPPPSPCKIHYPSDKVISWKCRRIKPGQTLEGVFGDHWEDVARFNRIDRRHVRFGVYLKVPENLRDIAGFTPLPQEYPLAGKYEKFVLIDLSEQFLGAYEKGELVFSSPLTTGVNENATPSGEFKISASIREHESTLYTIEESDVPYPMNYALRFYINRSGVSYFIHGRDLPGYPASHGCIGLYDEAMQKEYYGFPKVPLLNDARRLYEWAIAPRPDPGKIDPLENGPRVLIVGEAPGTLRNLK